MGLLMVDYGPFVEVTVIYFVFCIPILHSHFSLCTEALSHIRNRNVCEPYGGTTSFIVAMSGVLI